MKRLLMNHPSQPALSLSQISERQSSQAERTEQLWLWASQMTQILETPKLKPYALRASSCTQSRIPKASGKSLAFDQLALVTQGLWHCAPLKGQEVHYDKAPATSHGHTKPSVHSKGLEFEHARAQRASYDCKN